MDKQRRKAISVISSKISPLSDFLYGLRSDLEPIKDDEEEYFENMPEGLKNSENG